MAEETEKAIVNFIPLEWGGSKISCGVEITPAIKEVLGLTKNTKLVAEVDKAKKEVRLRKLKL